MEPKILEAIHFVHSYAPDITEWKVLKKELLRTLPSDRRKLFSTRDAKTKKQNFNDFEKDVALQWKKITGIDLYLNKL